MTEGIEVPDLVCWHEGMELLPQHFQLQSLRADGMAARQIQGLQPHFWGVMSLQPVFEPAKVGLKSLDAVMPDGLHVHIDAEQDAPLMLSEADLQAARARPFVTVHLTVSAQRLKRVTAASLERFVSTELTARDLTLNRSLAEPDAQARVPIWRPRLQLSLEPGNADTVSMPVLQLRNRGGELALVAYQPPCAVVSPESIFGRRLHDCLGRVRKVCGSLVAVCNVQSRAATEKASVEARIAVRVDRATLVLLMGRLVELEAAVLAGSAHPATLLARLHSLRCTLASIDRGRDLVLPPVPATYEHTDVLASLQSIEQDIDTQLKRLIGRFDEQRLDWDEARKAYASLAAPQGSVLHLALEFPVGSDATRARAWMQAAYMASASRLEGLAETRSAGVDRHELSPMEALEFAKAENVLIYRLVVPSPAFVADEVLCVAVPSTHPQSSFLPLSLSLLVPAAARTVPVLEAAL